MIPSQQAAAEHPRGRAAAADATQRTPGVAYLRPGFGDLVRGAAARVRSRAAPPGPPGRGGGAPPPPPPRPARRPGGAGPFGAYAAAGR
ncbi:hypothetical protein AAHZ94_31205, partial [Streptomyces sp. HSW2009]